MARKIVSQKKFIKGVNAGTGVLTEPPGTVTRISNIVFTSRGSLQTMQGTGVVGVLQGDSDYPVTMGTYSAFLVTAPYPFYPTLTAPSSPTIPNIGPLSLTTQNGTANPPFITYYFAVVASTSAIGTIHSNYFTSLTGLFFPLSRSQGVTATGWAVDPTLYYSLYYLPGGPSASQGVVIAGPTLGAASLSYSGVLPATPLVTLPTPNNSFAYALEIGFVSAPSLAVQFAVPSISIPANPISPAVVSPGDPNFTFQNGLTPYGGITGFACPIPQITQFAEQAILILGNGYPPQSTDPTTLSSATLTALANTFQATYPGWQASVAWTAGSQIAVLVSGTDYVYTAQQDGVSGSGTPTFPTTLGATVADGQLFWKNAGPLTTSVAPRGAAHGIVYAGSLWLANTSPQTTTDNFDGPTCLKMSDSNNPNSWNPVNVAFIGKDDGTQITGLATYTVAEVGIAPTGSLVVFKEFATYQIIGVFGATDFAITQAQTDLGCIAARSITFIPGYGLIRLTHMGFAIFNGVRDQLVSEEIRPYIFGGSGPTADIIGIDFTYCYLSKGAELTSPPMYICVCPVQGSNGLMTRAFCYDLVLKAWTIFDFPWPINTLLQARAGEGTPLLLAGRYDGTGFVERLFANDVNWDSVNLAGGAATNTPISWNFYTTHVYQEGSSPRAFYRGVIIRGYASDSNARIITVQLEENGRPFVNRQIYVYPQPGSSQFDLNLDIGRTLVNCQLKVSGTGFVVIDALDWQVTAKAESTALVCG